jgi:rare lipoprotein A
MVNLTKLRTMSAKTSLEIWLLAGTATALLVAMISTVTSPTVHADAENTTLAGNTVAGTAVAQPTPAFASARDAALQSMNKDKKRIGLIRGIASWYGGVFNGRKTASGEKYDMHAMTACQPDLPFGSIVRVINRRNKKSVVVRINDRGDLVDDKRVIDLSYAAAQKLAMTERGLAKVDVEILSLGGAN